MTAAKERWFAMLDTGELVEIDAYTINEAFEKEPANTHWVFSEGGIREFVASALELLK
jgi:hypothetical protein